MMACARLRVTSTGEIDMVIRGDLIDIAVLIIVKVAMVAVIIAGYMSAQKRGGNDKK